MIEGAQAITVILLGNKGKSAESTLTVEGWAAIEPGKDLALLRVRVSGTRLRPLPMATDGPTKGDHVLAITDAASDGTISAVRSGKEVRDMLQEMYHRNLYEDQVRFDLDTEWIQSTASIGLGSGGSPLVNMRGEVCGVAAWTCRTNDRRTLKFHASSAHIRQLTNKAGTKTLPLTNLPPALA